MDNQFLSIKQIQTAKNLDSHGIYAWYYFPRFTEVDLERIETKLRSDDEITKEDGAKEAICLIESHFFKAYLYQRKWIADSTSDRYLRIPNSGVTPKFQLQMAEVPNDKYLREKLLSDPGLLRFWVTTIRNNTMSNFLSPIYIGKTEKQSFRKRLKNHVDEMRKLISELERLDTSTRGEWLQRKENEISKAGKSTFALRVVRNGLDPDFLKVVVMPIDVDENSTRIGDLEHFMNRIVRPAHGSR